MRDMVKRHLRLDSSGMSLIEVSILVLVTSLLLIPLLQMNELQRKYSKIEKHYGTLNTLSIALANYAYNTGKYPMPANPALPMDNAHAFDPFPSDYAQTAADCDGTTHSVSWDYGTNTVVPNPDVMDVGLLCRTVSDAKNDFTNTIYIGAVPVSVLGLLPQEGLDEYGDKYMYAVTRSMVSSANYTGVINVVSKGDPLATAVTTAHFVVISNGKNRWGSVDRNGHLNGGCPAAGDTNYRPYELYNLLGCKLDGTNAGNNFGLFSAIFEPDEQGNLVKKDAVNDYDDISARATYFDDAINTVDTLEKAYWAPREADKEYFVSSRNISLGYPSGDAVTQKFLSVDTLSIQSGNIQVLGSVETPKICKAAWQNTAPFYDYEPCFLPTDVATVRGSAAPLYCTDFFPLKGIAYDDTNEKVKPARSNNTYCDGTQEWHGTIQDCQYGYAKIDTSGDLLAGVTCAAP
jgi:hypothetical protein